MPLVGVGNAPLYERAIFCYDGTDYRVVKGDTDGNLVVAIKASQSITVLQSNAVNLKATVTIPTGQDIEAQSHGYVGSAWQKNPISFGYSGDQNEDLKDLDATAGTFTLTGETVPAGEIWNIQVGCVTNDVSANSFIIIQADVNGIPVVVAVNLAPTASRWYSWTGQVTLSAGDKMSAIFYNNILHDRCRFRYHGVRIDIDQ